MVIQYSDMPNSIILRVARTVPLTLSILRKLLGAKLQANVSLSMMFVKTYILCRCYSGSWQNMSPDSQNTNQLLMGGGLGNGHSKPVN